MADTLLTIRPCCVFCSRAMNTDNSAAGLEYTVQRGVSFFFRSADAPGVEGLAGADADGPLPLSATSDGTSIIVLSSVAAAMLGTAGCKRWVRRSTTYDGR